MGLARLVANPPPDRRRCMLDLGEGVQLPRHGHVLVPSHVPVPRSRPDTGPVTVGIGPRSRPCIMNPSLFVPWPSLRQCRGDLAQCTHPSRAYKALQTAMTTKGRTPGGGTPSHTSPECSACVRLCEVVMSPGSGDGCTALATGRTPSGFVGSVLLVKSGRTAGTSAYE